MSLPSVPRDTATSVIVKVADGRGGMNHGALLTSEVNPQHVHTLFYFYFFHSD